MGEKFVVAAGNLGEGFTFFGPFDSFDGADEYIRQNTEYVEYWIAPLYAPSGEEEETHSEEIKIL
jgi:hypothetical protein